MSTVKTPARTALLLVVLALETTACVRERARIYSGPPEPWRDSRIEQPFPLRTRMRVTLLRTENELDAQVERYASCFRIEVREIPRQRVGERVMAIGTYVLAAGLAATGVIVVGSAEEGKEGVVPAGLGVIAAGGGVLGIGVWSEGESSSKLAPEKAHRVRAPVNCNVRPVRNAQIVLRSDEHIQQAETDETGHATFASLPPGPFHVFVDGVQVQDVVTLP